MHIPCKLLQKADHVYRHGDCQNAKIKSKPNTDDFLGKGHERRIAISFSNVSTREAIKRTQTPDSSRHLVTILILFFLCPLADESKRSIDLVACQIDRAISLWKRVAGFPIAGDSLPVQCKNTCTNLNCVQYRSVSP